jgi:hypothetical protein
LERISPWDEPLEQVRGFILEEALAVFGGQGQVAANCNACPANAFTSQRPAWAGCYGMFYLAEAPAFHAAVEIAHRELGLGEPPSTMKTNPPWYGFWLESPLCEATIEFLLVLFDRIVNTQHRTAPHLEEFVAGLQASLQSGLPMYATLIPSGRLQGGHWKLDSHCRRCRAPRPLGDRICQVCGLAGEVCAGRTRKVQGNRPFSPLIRQLGASRLTAIIDQLHGADCLRNDNSI